MFLSVPQPFFAPSPPVGRYTPPPHAAAAPSGCASLTTAFHASWHAHPALYLLRPPHLHARAHCRRFSHHCCPSAGVHPHRCAERLRNACRSIAFAAARPPCIVFAAAARPPARAHCRPRVLTAAAGMRRQSNSASRTEVFECDICDQYTHMSRSFGRRCSRLP